jgi:transcriptional regulator with XRE-family HTH domain
MEESASFGELLRSCRKKASKRQAQAAKAIGVSRSVYSDVESGRRQRPFDGSQLKKLASLFQLSGKDAAMLREKAKSSYIERRLASIKPETIGFGGFIKAARTRKGLTQAETAKALAVSQGNYSKVERGKMEPFSWSKLEKIIQLLGMEPEEAAEMWQAAEECRQNRRKRNGI